MTSRFKEREENVKADIFHAYQALLKQTKPQSVSVTLGQDNNSMEAEEGFSDSDQLKVPPNPDQALRLFELHSPEDLRFKILRKGKRLSPAASSLPLRPPPPARLWTVVAASTEDPAKD